VPLIRSSVPDAAFCMSFPTIVRAFPGDVLEALATRQTHVPYRRSRLTHMLQDSLGPQRAAQLLLQLALHCPGLLRIVLIRYMWPVVPTVPQVGTQRWPCWCAYRPTRPTRRRLFMHSSSAVAQATSHEERPSATPSPWWAQGPDSAAAPQLSSCGIGCSSVLILSAQRRISPLYIFRN